jgi:hypothetical protein
LAIVHVGKKQEGKMGSKSIRCICIGYDEALKSYRCYNPETWKIIISRDVVFKENVMGV